MNGIEIYELLQRIDGGYEPSEKEKCELTNLQSLDLWNTGISTLPESIGMLTGLQSLNLSWTKISTLPESIGMLTALQSLDLLNVKISDLPESILFPNTE